jgi:hypothetical protein
VVTVPGGDLVAEECRRAGSGVGDQRLFLGQFQLEVIMQEPREALLDLFGFNFRSDEPEEVIVGLCRVPDYAERRRVCAGQRGSRASRHGIIPAA